MGTPSAKESDDPFVSSVCTLVARHGSRRHIEGPVARAALATRIERHVLLARHELLETKGRTERCDAICFPLRLLVVEAPGFDLRILALPAVAQTLPARV